MKRKKSPIFTFLTIFEIEKFTIIVKEKKCSQCEEKKMFTMLEKINLT